MSNLNRYDPFEDLLRGYFVRPLEIGTQAEMPTIKVDVKEKGNDYLVYAELPGIRKEDIHVDIDGGVVAISAERKQEKEVKEGERVLRSECTYGKLSRSFQLGQDIDEARSSAKFNDGVLELMLPKKAASAGKRLSIL